MARRPTIAQLTAQIEAQAAALEAAHADVAHLQHRIKHDYIELAEYRRVQGLLRVTQVKAAEREPRLDWGKLAREYCAAHDVRSVSRDELHRWAKERRA